MYFPFVEYFHFVKTYVDDVFLKKNLNVFLADFCISHFPWPHDSTFSKPKLTWSHSLKISWYKIQLWPWVINPPWSISFHAAHEAPWFSLNFWRWYTIVQFIVRIHRVFFISTSPKPFELIEKLKQNLCFHSNQFRKAYIWSARIRAPNVLFVRSMLWAGQILSLGRKNQSSIS